MVDSNPKSTLSTPGLRYEFNTIIVEDGIQIEKGRLVLEDRVGSNPLCPRKPPTIRNVLIAYKEGEQGGEQYIFIYQETDKREVLKTARKYCDDPDLSLSDFDFYAIAEHVLIPEKNKTY